MADLTKIKPSLMRAHLRETGRLVEVDTEGIGINDPRNTLYMSPKGHVLRAWGLNDSDTLLVNVATGDEYTMSNGQVSIMKENGELLEFQVSAGRSMRMLGVTSNEAINPPKVSSALTGKYGKNAVRKPIQKAQSEMLPIVELDDLPHPLTGKYGGTPATSETKSSVPVPAPSKASSLAGKYAKKK